MLLGISLIYFLPLIIGLLIIFLFVRTPHGAPFVPSKEETVRTMMSLVEYKPGDSAADIGSGNGKVVIALARKGMEAHGYEINPFLVVWSRYQIAKNRLSKQATIHRANLWKEDFSSYSLVTLYGIPSMMADLEKKLRRELPHGAHVISNTFPFPTWKPMKIKEKIFLYTQTAATASPSAGFQGNRV